MCMKIKNRIFQYTPVTTDPPWTVNKIPVRNDVKFFSSNKAMSDSYLTIHVLVLLDILIQVRPNTAQSVPKQLQFFSKIGARTGAGFNELTQHNLPSKFIFWRFDEVKVSGNLYIYET